MLLTIDEYLSCCGFPVFEVQMFSSEFLTLGYKEHKVDGLYAQHTFLVKLLHAYFYDTARYCRDKNNKCQKSTS